LHGLPKPQRPATKPTDEHGMPNDKIALSQGIEPSHSTHGRLG
jgi:hypothetical protein